MVEFKAEGPASAPGTSDTYGKDGDKWCSYVCRRVDTGEQKTLILPDAGEYCIGQYGGYSTSALGFSPQTHDTEGFWDTGNFGPFSNGPKFDNEIRKNFGDK